VRLSGVIWMEDVVEKLAEKHDVRQHEVRETLTGRSFFRRVEKGHRVLDTHDLADYWDQTEPVDFASVLTLRWVLS